MLRSARQLAALTDPAKLVTLGGQRAANPRVSSAWSHGREPEAVIAQAPTITGSPGEHAALVRAELLRIRTLRRSLAA